MRENSNDGSEFTEEQLRAALKRVGRDARQAAYKVGRPVVIVKGASLVELHPDGTERIIEPLPHQGNDAGTKE